MSTLETACLLGWASTAAPTARNSPKTAVWPGAQSRGTGDAIRIFIPHAIATFPKCVGGTARGGKWSSAEIRELPPKWGSRRDAKLRRIHRPGAVFLEFRYWTEFHSACSQPLLNLRKSMSHSHASVLPILTWVANATSRFQLAAYCGGRPCGMAITPALCVSQERWR